MERKVWDGNYFLIIAYSVWVVDLFFYVIMI